MGGTAKTGFKMSHSHLNEGDGPLGAAGAHPPAHGELLAHPRGALVLPSLHIRHPQPLPELSHGLPRRPGRRGRSGSGGVSGGLRRGAEALPPPRGGGERRRTRERERECGERGGLNLEPARGQAEEPGGRGSRHRQLGGGGRRGCL